MPRTSVFLALGLALAAPAWSQDRSAPLDTRVERIEKQLRAVQRKVFPGGDQAFTTAEIAPPETVATSGVPASLPLNDLKARVDALEQTARELTAQVEQAEHRLTVLSQQTAKDRQEFSTRLQLLEAAANPPAPAIDAPPAPVARPAPGRPLPVAPAPAAADATAPAAAGADAGEEAYLAGYRLWTQKKYAEAQTALAAMAKKYPKHRRASYAQNLLGRAYLDAGQPARAAEAFAANYQTNPRGERAPESLYYLGQSLVKLNKPTDACRVYDELDAAYGASMEAGLKARVATARTAAKCK